MFVQRVRRKRRFLHRSVDRAVRRPVQLNRALRDEVGIFSCLVCEAVEEFVELGESRPLDIPMRLFVGGRQGRHVRQIQIQHANKSFLDISIECRSLLPTFCALHGITHGPRIKRNAA